MSGKVKVHVRRLASTGRLNPGELEVYCPHQDVSVAVELCKACDKFVTCGADPASGRVYVECRELTVASARSLRAARRATLARRSNVPASLAEVTPVVEIMTRGVACVRSGLELGSVRPLFSDGAPALPVVNEHREPIGILLRSTVARASVGKAADLMSRLSFVLPDSATVAQAAALMAIESTAHLPIVGEDGHVVGMVSWLELLRWYAQADGYVVPDRES